MSRYDKEEGVGKTAAIDGIGGIVLLFAAVKGEKGNNRQEGEKKGEESRKKGCRVEGGDPTETRGGIVLVGMGFAPSRFLTMGIEKGSFQHALSLPEC